MPARAEMTAFGRWCPIAPVCLGIDVGVRRPEVEHGVSSNALLGAPPPRSTHAPTVNHIPATSRPTAARNPNANGSKKRR